MNAFSQQSWVLAFLLLFGLPALSQPDSSKARQRAEGAIEDCADAYHHVPSISIETLLSPAHSNQWILVDVRDDHERKVSTIEGALSKEAFVQRKAEYAQDRIVTFCTAGCRSGRLARDLRKEGIEAYNLRGGILAWAWANKDLVEPDGSPTKRVHVFGDRWNLLPDDYEAVW